jgi:hypothetical protein
MLRSLQEVDADYTDRIDDDVEDVEPPSCFLDRERWNV